MDPFIEYHRQQTRRQFFGQTGLRMGGVALAGMLGDSFASGVSSLVQPALPGLPHFAPKAKRLIYLHMNGAPSQLDLWDHKPQLLQHFDKDLPDSIRNGQRITTMTSGQARFPVAPSMFKFTQHGQCGRFVSELLPHTAKIVDEIAVIKSVHTSAINHDPACTFVMTGSEVPGKPSIGSWLGYGLGSESNDLPSFVVFTPTFPAASQAQALFTRAATADPRAPSLWSNLAASYRALGLVVVAGLGLTSMLLWAIVSALGHTTIAPSFTLAGVTGLIVSIGITVDSYIVYFERLKDEARTGRSVRTSVDRGFQSAWRTVLAADFVSLLAAVILYFVAIGAVRGFAFFLGLSTILDIVLTYYFTRPAVILLGRSDRASGARRFGVARGLNAGAQADREPDQEMQDA